MFYIVKGIAYRTKGNTDNPVEIYKEFRDENPLIAREKSFQYFQSLLDVLLEGIGKEYTTYEQAEEDLEDYLTTRKAYNKLGLPNVELGMGFSISFVYDETIEHQSDKITIYKGEKAIHGLEYEEDMDFIEIYLQNLLFEKKFYEEQGFEFEEKKEKFYQTLPSPIDFKYWFYKKHL